jgi:beta-glucosidase
MNTRSSWSLGLLIVLIGLSALVPGSSKGAQNSGDEDVKAAPPRGSRELRGKGSRTLEVEMAVEGLLARMSLAEKIGQMVQAERKEVSPADVTAYFLGSVLSGGGSVPGANGIDDWIRMADAFQAAAAATPAGIPILYGVDAVHGHNNVKGATIFPHNIGLGASRDPELVRQVARATAREVVATGLDWTFSPCVAVTRDERWGRSYESFGEDPELQTLLAAAFVEGLQGDLGREDVLACAKHFIGDGGVLWATGREGKIDRGDTDVDLLRELHLPGYLEAIKAGVGSIMVSYNSIVSEKLHGHRGYLSGLLKNELGFEGFVISDWNGIDEIAVADMPTDPVARYAKQIIQAANAGIDMFMVTEKLEGEWRWKRFVSLLTRAVNEGHVPMSRIDDAVTRILRVKQRAGLFGKDRSSREAMQASFGSRAHRDVARDAVRKSAVLLKNEYGALPIRTGDKGVKRIFVAGKSAKNIGNQCGGWTIEWQGRSGDITPGTSVLAGIRTAAEARGVVVDYDPKGRGAKGHDLAIAIIGETPYAEWFGDKADLNLDAEDVATLSRLARTGVPVVAVIISGRPLIISEHIKTWDAAIAAWLPGSEGDGIADLLFGDHDFSAKLPVTWPLRMDQIPINRGDGQTGLFPYGHGLSYGLP